MKLYNEDCLKVLKNISDESIDLVVTDCPYHIISGGCSTGAYGTHHGIFNKEPIDNSQCLEPNECKILLDCITNLQKERNNLKASLDESQEVVADYKRENEKLLKKSYSDDVIITKALDKLYCWGETLNPEFQKEMLNILETLKVADKKIIKLAKELVEFQEEEIEKLKKYM